MALRGRAALPDDDDDFYGGGTSGAGEQQRLLVREQDETIGNLAKTVARVQGMAVAVNEELASQNKMISEIDDDVVRTDARLKTLNTKLRSLANDSDRGKYCLILVLMILLGFLILLVLS